MRWTRLRGLLEDWLSTQRLLETAVVLNHLFVAYSESEFVPKAVPTQFVCIDLAAETTIYPCSATDYEDPKSPYKN